MLTESRVINGKVAASTHYQIIPEERVVSVHFGVYLTFADIKAYAEALAVDPRFNHYFSEIVDLSAVQEVKLTADQALLLADAIDPFSVNARRAFVACTDLQIRAVRMHQILRKEGNNHILIFPSFEAAMKWASD